MVPIDQAADLLPLAVPAALVPAFHRTTGRNHGHSITRSLLTPCLTHHIRARPIYWTSLVERARTPKHPGNMAEANASRIWRR
jgi:hypothetical protein